MQIISSEFKGTLPAIAPRKLPEQYAQTSVNCDYRDGRLRPIRGLADEQALSEMSKSIFKADEWLSFTGDVSLEWASAFDDDGRLYYTGDSYPKQRLSDGTVMRLGVPKPAGALSVALQGTPDDGAKVKLTTAYIYTYVNSIGEEGGFSPASPVVEVKEGQHTRLTGFSSIIISDGTLEGGMVYEIVATEVDYFGAGLEAGDTFTSDGTETCDASNTVKIAGFTPDKIRIYRSSTGNTTGNVPYRLVEEVDYATVVGGNYDDEKDNEDLGYTAETEYFDIPEDDIEGLLNTQNGLLYAYKDNEIHISEPYVAYAWPSEYQKTTESEVMGTGFFEGAVIITTRTRPYILYGYSPESMEFKRLPWKQACVSKKGVVNMPGGVVYPTPTGLFMISGGQTGLITQDVILHEDWTLLEPEKIMAIHWRGNYLAFFEGEDSGFIFNPNDPYFSFIDLGGVLVRGIHYNAEDDAVFLSVTDGTDEKIVEWDKGAYLTYTRKSKEFFNPRKYNFSSARVVGDFSGGKDVTMKIYGDKTLLLTHTATDDSPFRLPAGMRYNSVEWEAEGDADIDSVYIGTGMEEIHA